MTTQPSKRRRLVGAVLIGGTLAIVGLLTGRFALVGLALGSTLKGIGASDISYQVTAASPWRVVVEDLGFILKTQPFTARRVSMDRAHWWTPSLGRVRVEQARLAVKPPALQALLAPEPAGSGASSGTVALPLEELSFDGQLVLQGDDQPGQALTVELAGRLDEGRQWAAEFTAKAPGLDLTGSGRYDPSADAGEFAVPAVAVDLKAWQAFVGRILPLPDLGGWEGEGRVSGHGSGRWVAGKVTASGVVQVREGRLQHAQRGLDAEGVEIDLEFTDFAQVHTQPGTLRVREVRTGQLTLRDVAAGFTLTGPDQVDVAHATLTTLGGTVTTEPFRFVPSRNVFTAVVLVDGISVEQVMALTPDLPAKATGRVNGRFPLSIDGDGLHLGTGWLALKPGVEALIQFNAKGLLTGGAAPGTPSYAVLQKVESGLLKLNIQELRLDIRPPNAPAGRSATLHLKGSPLDPEVKAPVILDLNVNGPLEKLLSLGFDSRLSLGGKP